MSMFDHYVPDPPLYCPLCEADLDDWQGQDGPSALMVWRQGVAGPIDQAIEDEEVRLEPHRLAAFRLPEIFSIYTWCCGGPFAWEADCHATDGIWSRTELITAETARQKSNERRGEFKARIRWLRGEVTYRDATVPDGEHST